MDSIEAWWFSKADRVLCFGDGRKAAVGITHEVEGEIIPCKNGLHGSKVAMDALSYATGPVVWRVKLHGDVVDDYEKHVASHRTYLAGGVNSGAVLRRFAWACAMDVYHLWSDEELPDHLKNWDGEDANELSDIRCKAEKAETAGKEIGLVVRENVYAASAVGYATRGAGQITPWSTACAAAWKAARAEVCALKRNYTGAEMDSITLRQNGRLTGMLNRAIQKGCGTAEAGA